MCIDHEAGAKITLTMFRSKIQDVDDALSKRLLRVAADSGIAVDALVRGRAAHRRARNAARRRSVPLIFCATIRQTVVRCGSSQVEKRTRAIRQLSVPPAETKRYWQREDVLCLITAGNPDGRSAPPTGELSHGRAKLFIIEECLTSWLQQLAT